MDAIRSVNGIDVHDVEVYSSSLHGYMEDSTESGRYKSLEPPKLASSSKIVPSEGENGSVESWREEFRVEVESEHNCG